MTALAPSSKLLHSGLIKEPEADVDMPVPSIKARLIMCGKHHSRGNAADSGRDIGPSVCHSAGDVLLLDAMVPKHLTCPLHDHLAGDLSEGWVWSEQLHGEELRPQDALVIYVEDAHT